MGTLRNINKDYLRELTSEQLDIIIDKIKKGYYIQFKCIKPTELNLYKFEFVLGSISLLCYKSLLRLMRGDNKNKETRFFFELYPMSKTTGTELNIDIVSHDGYKTNHFKSINNIKVSNLKKLLFMLEFDIEFYIEELEIQDNEFDIEFYIEELEIQDNEIELTCFDCGSVSPKKYMYSNNGVDYCHECYPEHVNDEQEPMPELLNIDFFKG